MRSPQFCLRFNWYWFNSGFLSKLSKRFMFYSWLKVLSNGRYRSVHHRAIMPTRVSIAMFYGPNVDAVIGPIKDLIDEKHPPRYGNYRFAEFLGEFSKQEGTRRMVKRSLWIAKLRMHYSPLLLLCLFVLILNEFYVSVLVNYRQLWLSNIE